MDTEGEVVSPDVIVFRCANCSRPGMVPEVAVERCPVEPRVEWPMPVREVVVPCTGRLQPEHLLKAFEAGARAVCVIACAGDNCHCLEGSRRAERRVDYVRELLDELGLGSERLMLFHLPGSAHEDMTLGWAPRDGSPGKQLSEEELASRLAAVCEKVMAKVNALEPNPLG
jgi:F420-non-reducing hydrogenase iron-sulfur subunit